MCAQDILRELFSLPSLPGSMLRYALEFQRNACSLPPLLPGHRLRRVHQGYAGAPGPLRRGIADCQEAYRVQYERHPRTPAALPAQAEHNRGCIRRMKLHRQRPTITVDPS